MDGYSFSILLDSFTNDIAIFEAQYDIESFYMLSKTDLDRTIDGDFKTVTTIINDYPNAKFIKKTMENRKIHCEI